MKTTTKQKFYILLTAIFFALNIVTSQTTVGADNANIQYSGRIDFSNPSAPQFAYSGVAIKTGFTGTSISVKLSMDKENDFYYIIIDEGAPFKLEIDFEKDEYVLAENLPDTNHIIEIISLNEDFGDIITFSGFIIDTGKTLIPAPAAPSRIIEFIGDSITCGAGNESLDTSGFNNRDLENFYKSYASFTSRAFNAQTVAVAKSGRGVYRKSFANIAGTEDSYQFTYPQVYANRNNPVWGFDRQIPDVVCINLGTNDMSGTFDVSYDIDLYEAAYVSLVKQVRAKYPLAHIVLLQGVLICCNKLIQQTESIGNIMAELAVDNVSNISNFAMERQVGKGAGFHPNEEQHVVMSNELTGYLSELMSWNIYPTLVYAKAENVQTEVDVEFNYAVDGAANAASDFKVNADGTIIDVVSITGSGKNYKLTLANPIGKDQQVGVTYNPGSIQYQGTAMLKQGIEAHNLISLPLSVKELEKENNVKFFPNPVDNVLNIKAEGDYTALIYDLNGRLILEKTCTGNSEIKTSALAKGVYTVKLKYSTSTVVSKLVKN